MLTGFPSFMSKNHPAQAPRSKVTTEQSTAGPFSHKKQPDIDSVHFSGQSQTLQPDTSVRNKPSTAEESHYTGPHGHTIFREVVSRTPKLLQSALQQLYSGDPQGEEKVFQLLKYGADPNIKNPQGTPALIEALKKKNSKIYDWLIKEPTLNINAADANEWTALTHLARGYLEIKKGYDQNQQEKFRRITQLFIHPQLDLQVAKQGDKIREWAGYSATPAMIKQLHRAGIDLYSPIEYNIRPLEHLACRGDLRSIRFLLDKRPEALTSTPDGANSLVFHRAANSGNEALLQDLLDRGASELVLKRDKRYVDANENEDEEGGDWEEEDNTSLHAVASSGNARAIALLLNNGAQSLINTVNNHNKTALMMAARTGQPEAVGILLDQGALDTVNAVDRDGKTALHHAAGAGNVDAVQLLLETGALSGINRLDADQHSPLYYAAKRGVFSTFQLLWDHGGSPSLHVRNDSDENILYTAVSGESTDIVDFLLTHGAADHTLEPPRIGKWWPGNYQPGVSMVNEPEAHNRRPLGIALQRGNLTLVKRLLAHGATVNYWHENETPLHIVARNKENGLALARLLFEHGAAKSLLLRFHGQGRTPLEEAQLWENPAVVQLFSEELEALQSSEDPTTQR